jgi:hypothetical protein
MLIDEQASGVQSLPAAEEVSKRGRGRKAGGEAIPQASTKLTPIGLSTLNN